MNDNARSRVVTTVEKSMAVMAVPERRVVSTSGSQGPQGIQGIQGPAGGQTITAHSDVPISGHKVVCAGLSGNVQYASNLVASHANKVLGITSNAASAGDALNVIRNGEMTEPTWNWTLDVPIYLGEDGGLTQTPPVAPAKFCLLLGFPITETTVFFGIQPPIVLTL